MERSSVGNTSRSPAFHAGRQAIAMVSLILLSLLLGSSLPSNAQAPQSESPETQTFDSARRVFEDKSYVVAERFLGEFIQQFPQSERVPEALLLQARAALYQGKTDAAIQLLKNNIGKSAKLTDEYRFWIGEALFLKGSMAEAAEAFGAMLKDFPNSGRKLEAAYEQARALFKLGRWEQVVEVLRPPNSAFRAAMQDRRNDERVVAGELMLIEALLQLKRFADAITVIESIAKINFTPELRWRFEQLYTRVLNESRQFTAALAQSTNAVKAATVSGLPGATADSTALQASILTRLNRLTDAASIYELNLRDGVPAQRQKESLIELIQLHLAQNQFAQATQRLELLLKRSLAETNSDIMLLTYGEVFLREYALARSGVTNDTTNSTVSVTNLLQEALSRLDRLVATQPSSPILGRAHLQRGWCLWAMDRLPESLDAFRSAVSTLPESEDKAVALFKMGEVQFQLKDLTNALSSFQSLTNQYASLPRVQNQLLERALEHLLRIHLELKHSAGATAALQSLLSWKPNSEYLGPNLLMLGQGLTLLQQPQEARKWLEKLPPESPLKAESQLAIARTYAEEGLYPQAATSYEQWLAQFPDHALRSRAEFQWAWTTDQARDLTNAYVRFTNFLARFPNDPLAPRAQFWLGDYYFRIQNFTNAELQFEDLCRNTNWTAGDLFYLAKMQAGRAAFARQGFNNATAYFRQILNDSSAPVDFVVQALFALGDCYTMQATLSTNVFAQYLEASKAFENITRVFPTNALVARAWGNLGNCYFQLSSQDTAYHDRATNAYHQVLAHPLASVSDRSQAEVGLGILQQKLAESTAASQRPDVIDAAQLHFQRVLYEKNLRPGELPDRFWQKQAGLAAADLAESTQDLELAVNLLERLKLLIPSLSQDLDRRIARLRTRARTASP